MMGSAQASLGTSVTGTPGRRTVAAATIGRTVKSKLSDLRNKVPGPGAYTPPPTFGAQYNSQVRTSRGAKFGTGKGKDVFKPWHSLDEKLNKEPTPAEGAKDTHGFGGSRRAPVERKVQAE